MCLVHQQLWEWLTCVLWLQYGQRNVGGAMSLVDHQWFDCTEDGFISLFSIC